MILDNLILCPINPQSYKIEGCFVDDNKRFAFLHIYKNASISFRNVMGMRGRYHKFSEVCSWGLSTVTILRDPNSRIISSYLYLLRLEDNGLVNQHPTFLTSKTKFYSIRDVDIIESFNLFLDSLEGFNFYDAVTYPQHLFISDRGLSVSSIDDVLILERIEEDFENFKTKHCLPQDLKISQDNTDLSGKTELLKSYLLSTKKIQDKINILYSEDFDMYNKFL